MKIGDYVRFRDKKGNQYIRKITKVCDEEPYKRWGAIIVDKNANNVPYVSAKNIIKSSSNIIDLIEEGDYVNGKLVIEHAYQKGRLFVTNLYIGGKGFTTCEDYSWELTKKDEDLIETIVTKEQFSSMEYRIGE